ncbi:MAG: hypothetical protein R3A79_10600 [Nannocystaceae bacterium]
MLRLSCSLLTFLLLVACNGDDAGIGESDTDATSGATTQSSTGATEGSAATGEGTTEDIPGGDLRGLIDFTYAPADALIDEPLLGIAGAYRMEALALDNLYALVGLQLNLPAAPEALDTVVEYAPLPFDWGKADTWIAAGNGIRLSPPAGADGLACLTLADDDYPLYLAADSAALDPECAPDPAAWIPASPYDLEIYGGDLFDDALLRGVVTTPAELVVSAPALDVFDLPIDPGAALDVAWEAGDDAEARVVIRLWDQYGQGVVAAAADDGAFSIPAANLAALSAGPGFLTVARERAHTINFSAGQLRVITRYERWGYVDILD